MSDNNSSENLKKLLKQKEIELAEKEKKLAEKENEIQGLKKTNLGLYWDKEREPEQVVLDCEKQLPVLKRIKKKEIKSNSGEENILIEGDNFHALTCLNYTHKEKIDVIYIDPPYNTGNEDFKYNDRFIGAEDGYCHSKWLNFMEKRLMLAKNLLKDTGVIFISIDDNEQANLKLLCDQVFGRENFVVNLIWQSKGGSGTDDKLLSNETEYILSYAKNKSKTFFNNFEYDLSSYNLKDEYFTERGSYKLNQLDRKSLGYQPSLDFKIKQGKLTAIPGGSIVENKKKQWRWRWSFEKVKWGLENKFIVLQDNGKGQIKAYFKMYTDVDNKLNFEKRTRNYNNLISEKISTSTGTKELEEILGSNKFQYPKSTKLINHILNIATQKESIVCDFMAGSGTTGHAVLALNKEDGGNRKFILCTNNENNICEEVTYSRIKKVIKGYSFQGKDKTTLYTKEIKNYTALKKVDVSEIEDIKETYEKNYDTIPVSFTDGILKVEGVKNITDKKEGLGGNLHYFKTEFVKKTRQQDQVRQNLTQKCTEMLCVKEGIFDLVKEGQDFKIFTNLHNDRYLCIYYNLVEESFKNFYNSIKLFEGRKFIYMFSLNNKVERNLFLKIKSFSIEAIPENILNIYKDLVKMTIAIKPNLIFKELNKAKLAIFKMKDKDNGARILRIVLEKILQKICQNNNISLKSEKNKEKNLNSLNEELYKNGNFTQVQQEENKTFMTIGNQASHGEYNEYDLSKVENFYYYCKNLINRNIK